MKFIKDNNLYEAWANTVFRTTNVVTDAIGRGFRSVRLEILKALTKRGIFKLPKDANILVMNDFDLTVTKILREYGYANISLLVVDNSENKCLTSFIFNIKYKDKSFKKLFPDGLSFWKNIFYVQTKEVNDIGKRGPKKTTHTEYIIEGVKDLKFDLILANPPYGPTGANITKTIIDTVKFDYYINLLPANDYKRNTTKDLYNYQSDMEAINNGFKGDASVTTHLACIHADKVNTMTLEDFEMSTYLDAQLTKYFKVNSERNHYAIDNHICKPKIARFRRINLRNCFYYGKREVAAKYLTITPDSVSYRLNTNTLLDHDEFLALSSKSEQALGNSGNFTVVQFNTPEEKDNFVAFAYSDTGYKFIVKMFKSINVDCYVVPARFMPKVDWTRSWTVEEILADYGYTEEEIAEIMTDLNAVDANGKPKYKGME